MASLISRIDYLRQVLLSTCFTFVTPTSMSGTTSVTRALRILDDHVIPRLHASDAPLLAVIGGSTGSGKSTILNTLVQENLSASSVVRPTTRHPVLVHRPEDAEWFTNTTILPSLARVTRQGEAAVHLQGEPAHMELRQTTAIPSHLALLDAPDVDSVVEENRELARQMLDAADMWIFVTTAARYADAVPWSILAPAAQRGVRVALVLNRIPEGARDLISEDLRRLMQAQGLGDAPLFAIDEHPLTNNRLDMVDIAHLHAWLRAQAESQETRALIARQAVDASVQQVVESCYVAVDALNEQYAAFEQAKTTISEATDHTIRRILLATSEGAMLRGEVLTRWQDIVGAADLTRSLNRSVGLIRDRLTSVLTGKTPAVQPVEDALEAGLVTLIEDELLALRDSTEKAWRQHEVLASFLPQATRRTDAHEQALRATQEWQSDLLALIREVGLSKRQGARLMAVGVNVVTVALMIVIFASTGGLTGMEVGVAGASSALSQKLLEAIFGDQAVRSMTAHAQKLLVQRLTEACEEVLSPFGDMLNETDVPDAVSPDILSNAVQAVLEAERP